MDKVREWIKTREEHPKDKIEFYDGLGIHFPDGPQEPRGFVNIVVVTDEGVLIWVSAN